MYSHAPVLSVSPRVRVGIARLLAVATLTLPMLGGLRVSAEPITGAIFTTESACDGTNVNIFQTKEDVYLDGGPAHEGAAGLPDGSYYVQVTEPGGALLGASVGTPVHVTDSSFDACYQLAAIVVKASDGTPGYDTTTNGGGEYKVWVSKDPTFPGGTNKTDNFKVIPNEGPPMAELCISKYYDANANGIDDDNLPLTGWQVTIQQGDFSIVRTTPICVMLDPGTYTVTESDPAESNWFHTTPTSVEVALADGDHSAVTFGNLCLGGGGAKTLGFWSNKNGQAQVGADDLALLVSLNLRTAAGGAFDPSGYAAFRAWLLSATATNMAYMLSAQLSAMELNVYNGLVNGGALVYAPGTQSANALGFATVSNLMAEANTALGANGLTLAGSPDRAYQEALKNALDNANNNLTFVQQTPCPFSFPS